MQLDTPMKKEVARWYWLMMDIVDGEFNLPEEIWRECMPEPQLKDLWQVSTTLLYNTVKPAALRQDNVVRCKKCGSSSADDLHMFIDCPLFRKFWHEVGDAIKEILPTSPKAWRAKVPSQQSVLEEILKAAREAAAMQNKDWLLRQISGQGASKRAEQNVPSDEASAEFTREETDAMEEPKNWQQNVSGNSKKGDKKNAGGATPAIGVPALSKRAKVNNGEQISVIVQEYLKSFEPLVFANKGYMAQLGGSGVESLKETMVT
ncbi:hypothetical protein NDU88_005989 [Pleurodeles waltl]|uniref:Reverse transcriptase zinc-binding domain-containing protein n=1 Tax=Pleurodeles waltl TaxID=8319 RepID=A0AAV7TCP4_PLEWA|nr:hypothetical protein NDU88_005989 [Pleurodeles waltl]